MEVSNKLFITRSFSTKYLKYKNKLKYFIIKNILVMYSIDIVRFQTINFVSYIHNNLSVNRNGNLTILQSYNLTIRLSDQ
jgi:hypothetical protein